MSDIVYKCICERTEFEIYYGYIKCVNPECGLMFRIAQAAKPERFNRVKHLFQKFPDVENKKG